MSTFKVGLNQIRLVALAAIVSLSQLQSYQAVGPLSNKEAFNKLCLIEYQTKDLHDKTLGTELADVLWAKYTDIMEQRISLGAELSIHFCPSDVVGHLLPADAHSHQKHTGFAVDRPTSSVDAFNNLCVLEQETKDSRDRNLDLGNKVRAEQLWTKYLDIMAKRLALGSTLNIHYCPSNHLVSSNNIGPQFRPQTQVSVPDGVDAFHKLCLLEYETKRTIDNGKSGDPFLWVTYEDAMKRRVELGAKLKINQCPSDLVGHLYASNTGKYPQQKVRPQYVASAAQSSASIDTFHELCMLEYETKKKMDDGKGGDSYLWSRYKDAMDRRIQLGAQLKIYFCPKSLVGHLFPANIQKQQKQQRTSSPITNKFSTQTGVNEFNNLCLDEYRTKFLHDQRLGSGEEEDIWNRYVDLMDRRIELGARLKIYFCPFDLVGHLTPMRGEKIDQEPKLQRIFNELCYKEASSGEMCRYADSQQTGAKTGDLLEDNRDWCKSYESKKRERIQFAQIHMLNPSCGSELIAYAKEEAAEKRAPKIQECDTSCKPKRGLKHKIKKLYDFCCTPQVYTGK